MHVGWPPLRAAGIIKVYIPAAILAPRHDLAPGQLVATVILPACRMDHPSDDDLFQDSTMTFGEHLEELRGSLFKAVAALILGFLLGMAIGNWIVELIKAPLKTALESYYSDLAVKEFQKRLEEREAGGEVIPAELKDPEAIKQLVYEDKLLFEEAYIRPQEILDGLKDKYPGVFDKVELPKVDPDRPVSKKDLLRLFVFRTHNDDLRVRIMVMNTQEGFIVWMKASFVAGAILSSPFVFWFLWSFVAAGLYPHERRYINVFLPFSVGLFLTGAAVAYFFAFPLLLRFFFEFNEWLGIEMDLRLSEWLSFVLMMPLGFGISFQLPLIMLFLERIGVMTVQGYKNKWRIAILLIAIASMVLTPTTDPYSMMLMFVPLSLLYFGGILLCMRTPKGRARKTRGVDQVTEVGPHKG